MKSKDAFRNFLLVFCMAMCVFTVTSCGRLPVEAVQDGDGSPSEIILRKNLLETDGVVGAETTGAQLSEAASSAAEDKPPAVSASDITGREQTGEMQRASEESTESIAVPGPVSVGETDGVPSTVSDEISRDETQKEETVYWVAGGSVWHLHSECPSLLRSREILQGTVQDAIESGKERVCKRCGG